MDWVAEIFFLNPRKSIAVFEKCVFFVSVINAFDMRDKCLLIMSTVAFCAISVESCGKISVVNPLEIKFNRK